MIVETCINLHFILKIFWKLSQFLLHPGANLANVMLGNWTVGAITARLTITGVIV